jgi:hypothetical protein
MTPHSRKAAADLIPGDLVRLDRLSGWREVGSVHIKYHVRIDGSLYHLDADQMLDLFVPSPNAPPAVTESNVPPGSEGS